MRETNCANTEGIFRIIQSIPSPKAEPFKRWLAKVGYERVQDDKDLEMCQKRQKRFTRPNIVNRETTNDYRYHAGSTKPTNGKFFTER